MSVEVATAIVYAALAYAGVGVIFAIPFVLVGAGRIDSAAKDGTRGFRVLVFPGAAALWPLLLMRWVRGGGDPPEERSPHRKAAEASGGDP